MPLAVAVQWRAIYRRVERVSPHPTKQPMGLCAAGSFSEAITLLEPWDRSDAKTPEVADFPKDRADILGLGLYTLALAKEEQGWYDDALKLYRQAERACGDGFASGGETAENARMAIARRSATS